MKDYQLHDLV